MKVFDFDNTLYFGESAIDFVLFLIKKNKKILLWVPTIFFGLLKYKLCLISKERIEKITNDFMESVIKNRKDIEDKVDEFWHKYGKNLNIELINQIEKEDAIITAGPSFLIEKIKDCLKTANIICSNIDLETKKVISFNFGENKVKSFYEKYGDKSIESFYTDSFNDQAMMNISQKVFLVKRKKIKQIK